jgi:hypothetical protein
MRQRGFDVAADAPSRYCADMASTRNSALSLFFGLLLVGSAVPASADDGCLNFKWDVSQERALFASAPTTLQAGKDPMSVPMVIPNGLYSLQLSAQDQVTYKVTPPAKKSAAPVYGGLAGLKISAPGVYRIAMDLPAWIDVVADGALVKASDFQGQHECSAPHKIVEFELTGTRPLLLQLSNVGKDKILLTVTAAPPRKF